MTSGIRLARHAMATRFELLLPEAGALSSSALRAAGEEALSEIERLESQLSLYQPTSEIAHVNCRAATERVRVSPTLFGLLEHSLKLYEETDGAFDITIGPLVRCWGFIGGQGKLPAPEAVEEARSKTGMRFVELRREDFTVHFARAGMMVDLGAIGKGYAIEQAAEILRDSGVESALLHGGTSSIYGIGKPPEADVWMIGIQEPGGQSPSSPSDKAKPFEAAAINAETENNKNDRHLLAEAGLRDQAMSVSGVWGRSFEAAGESYGHVLDPRTGKPTRSAVMAAVILDSATETDALSTALLVHGFEGHDKIADLRSNMKTLVARESDAGLELKARAITVKSPLKCL